mmetsp:Transcript_46479/g.46946  ORF Transcript_46479/g.46946 Transcript_46479/m.46946 type:complete len:81 (+) Transcript_46479:306-548(+)
MRYQKYQCTTDDETNDGRCKMLKTTTPTPTVKATAGNNENFPTFWGYPALETEHRSIFVKFRPFKHYHCQTMRSQQWDLQ